MGRCYFLLLLLVPLACAPPPQQQVSTTHPQRLSHRPREPFSGPKQIKEQSTATAVQIDTYQLSVPFGAISRNDKFWKRIDEDCVDRITYDVLFKNGVRVGQAPIAQWDYFKKIMADSPANSQLSTILSPQAKAIELPMHKQVDHQNIFYYDAASTLVGRTYEQSQNIITLTVEPAPRKPDTVRLALCPVVRSTRKRLSYSVLNNAEEITYTTPERLYDLNLRTDVPAGSFLVVAPSTQATWPTSIGNTFLVTSAPAERMETVLLFVPHIIRAESADTPLADVPPSR